MSAVNMEISEPTLLAKLPRAGPSEEGLRRFSQVYGIRDGKSKKRHEVCAAIDGNSLNIFEVVNGRNIASWPTPPDATFVSQPYSERRYIDTKTFARRCWCAVQQKGRTTIQLFEQIRSGSTTKSTTTKYALGNLKSPVIKIDSVGTNQRLVVIAQEDGSITCISSEGHKGQHERQLGIKSNGVKLHTVQSMSLADARSSILKGRPDLSGTFTEDHTIIAAVYNTTQTSSTAMQGLSLGIWALAPVDGDAAALEPVITHDLLTTTKATACFKSASTKLEIQNGALISTFDMTAIRPQKVSERALFTKDQTSNIELSYDVNLSFGSGKLNLYNSKFNSLLASTQISSAPLKRKRDGPSLARLSFIAYFSQLRRVLAYSGSQLLAVDILVRDSTPNPFKQSSLLVGNILRGQIEQTAATQAALSSALDQDWARASEELDALAHSQDVEGFERKYKETFSIDKWEDMKNLDSTQIKFLISRILNVKIDDGNDKAKLRVALPSVQLLEWCVRCGFLDEYQISCALEMRNSVLYPGAVFDSLQSTHRNSELHEKYIKYAPYIQPSALAKITKSLIKQALKTPEMNTAHHTSTGSEMDIDEQLNGRDLVYGSEGPQIQTVHSTNSLVYALRRLALTGSATVSEQVRTVFEQKEVLALIQFLRQQLFLGGYTRLAEVRAYPSPPLSQTDGEDASLEEVPRVTLEGIVTLLNGCIDSLGVVGVLGPNDDQAFLERLVPELYSEIESATAAVEDSTYLQGILRETLRYAESVERQPFEVRTKTERANDTPGQKGKIVTLYSEGESFENGGQTTTALPLSLKAEENLSQRKVRKGGQIQSRSAREMGMLKDRLKAPYSFERLIL